DLELGGVLEVAALRVLDPGLGLLIVVEALERLDGVLGLALEHVPDGDDVDLRGLAVHHLVGVQDVADGPGAAAATPDQPDPDPVALGGERPGGEAGEGDGPGGGRGLEEVAAVGRIASRHGRSSSVRGWRRTPVGNTPSQPEGLGEFMWRFPRALPWAMLSHPFGLKTRSPAVTGRRS